MLTLYRKVHSLAENAGNRRGVKGLGVQEASVQRFRKMEEK